MKKYSVCAANLVLVFAQKLNNAILKVFFDLIRNILCTKEFNYQIYWENMVRAIVLGGSRGIGKAIADCLKSINIDVFATSKKDVDTSDLSSVKKFLEKNTQTDILVLNTGGPSPKLFQQLLKRIGNYIIINYF